MLCAMKPFILILLLFPLLSAHAAPRVWTIDAEQWQRPRHGERVSRFPGLADAVREWMSSPQTLILIRYPGGENGQLWSQELRDWLVALGVPSNRIRLRAGLPYGDRLLLTVISDEDSET